MITNMDKKRIAQKIAAYLVDSCAYDWKNAVHTKVIQEYLNHCGIILEAKEIIEIIEQFPIVIANGQSVSFKALGSFYYVQKNIKNFLMTP